MINYSFGVTASLSSPLGDAQTGYMNVLRTIDDVDHSYSIDMEILTDYFNPLFI